MMSAPVFLLYLGSLGIHSLKREGLCELSSPASGAELPWVCWKLLLSVFPGWALSRAPVPCQSHSHLTQIRSRWGYFFLQQSKMSSAWTQFAVGVGVQKACAQMTSLSPTPLAKQNPAICETWPWWTARSAMVGGLILLFRAINFQLTYKVRTQEALVPKHDNVKCCWGSCWRNDTSPDVGCGGLLPHGVS